MSGPSRRPEIRRRRTRKAKLDRLRAHYKSAKTDAERKLILDKLVRIYPGVPAAELLGPDTLEAAKRQKR